MQAWVPENAVNVAGDFDANLLTLMPTTVPSGTVSGKSSSQTQEIPLPTPLVPMTLLSKKM